MRTYTLRKRGPIDGVLDLVQDHLGAPNRVVLYDMLKLNQANLSRSRASKRISSQLLLKLHDATGIPVNDLRRAAGLPAVTPLKRKL